MSLYEGAVKKPIMTSLCFLAVAIFGLFSLSKLPVDLYPDIDTNTIMVMTSYQGASASDIENNVTRPLENTLNSVSNLKHITSKSSENISVITLEFEYGYDIDVLTNDVRDKLDMVSSELPDVLGAFIKPLRKFFPSVVTGTVVLSIGLSLISVGINSFGGGSSAKDFGSLENLFLAFVVLVVILFVKHWTKGYLSSSAILVGIIVGYIVAIIMGLVLPHTAFTADGVEYTKSWVLNWNKVAEAKWIAIPKFMPVKPVFDLRAILPVLVMFVVTAVETVGDISGVMEGGMGREATDKELSGGVMCDGLGSTLAAMFGVLPNTSFSQNVGLVAMTKVVNRVALASGAVFLILCGLIPKLGALISIMPQSVLGGAAVMMFSSIIVSGIQLITKEPLDARRLSIVSVALGVGYGMGVSPAILEHTPQAVQLMFGESGIVPAAFVAILLNVILPKSKPANEETSKDE